MKYNLVFVINSKYVEQLLVTLNSIFLNNEDKEFNVFLLESNLKEVEIDRINKYIENAKSKFIRINVDNNEIFNEFPILRKDFSKEAYYKLLIPILLPKEISKVLYLDVDIVVNQKIDSLYNINLNDYVLAACPDYFINTRDLLYKKTFGMSNEDKYFNSGVLLFNLDEIRKSYKIEEMIKYIKDEGKNFKYHDQQVFNKFYFKKYLKLPEKYNYITRFRNKIDLIKYILKKDENNVIYHFAGEKPWNINYFGKYGYLFWKYANSENFSVDKKDFMKQYKRNRIKVFFQKLKQKE